jgi:hypothetical protein
MSKQRASALLKRYKDGEASPDDVKALKQWGFLTKDGEVKINVSESEEDLDEENKCCGSTKGFITTPKGNKKCKACGAVYTDKVDKPNFGESEEDLDEKMVNIKKKDEGFYLRHKKTAKLDYGPFKTKELANKKLVTLDDENEYSVYNFVNEAEDLDEGRGRPKKAVDPDAPVKEKGKRGRPAKDVYDPDDEKEEGKRDLTLHAFIRGGKGKNKQEATESKTIKGAKPDDIKKLVQDFENVLTVKFANKWDFDDSDIVIDVKDNLGWSGGRAEDMTKDDDGGSDSEEDDSYSFGRKDK